jgi:outer membrane protein assembly factor BamB
MRKSAVILLACAALARGQRTPEYDHSVVSQVRIDARDLGYAPVDVIPSDESAIRALTVGPDGKIYGATSGKRSHLFVLDPVHGYVQPLGFLAGVATVHHALVVSKNGDVYIGGSNGVDTQGKGYEGYAGGHLLRYTPHHDDEKPIRVDAPCNVTDLGIAVPGEAVYALGISRFWEVIYGLSYPNGQFFSYNMAAGKFTIHGKVAEHAIPGEKFEKDKNIGRSLLMTADGTLYASGEDGALFRFPTGAQKLEQLPVSAPTVPGREPYNRVDAWAEDSQGTIYGGTSDGYLFRLDPKTMRLDNLGKPLNQYRIRGLVFARNGKLYGVGGDDDEMARLFSYDPANGAYQMLGMIDVNRRPYYSWQAYVIDAMAVGLDGTVYLGQSERRSRLYLYYPE